VPDSGVLDHVVTDVGCLEVAADAQADHADAVAASGPQVVDRGAHIPQGALSCELVQELEATGEARLVLGKLHPRRRAVVHIRGEGDVSHLGEPLAHRADMASDAVDLRADDHAREGTLAGGTSDIRAHRPSIVRGQIDCLCENAHAGSYGRRDGDRVTQPPEEVLLNMAS
jgi:hypothetical protein